MGSSRPAAAILFESVVPRTSTPLTLSPYKPFVQSLCQFIVTVSIPTWIKISAPFAVLKTISMSCSSGNRYFCIRWCVNHAWLGFTAVLVLAAPLEKTGSSILKSNDYPQLLEFDCFILRSCFGMLPAFWTKRSVATSEATFHPRNQTCK